jgi:hypothetical protein
VDQQLADSSREFERADSISRNKERSCEADVDQRAEWVCVCTKMDILVYEGNLDVEELLDWIRALDTYFDYEDVEEDKKVKHAIKRLKGHATLWWDELQADRRCQGKKKIKTWDRMISKMKEKFIPRDYQISLFRRM